MLVNFGRQAIYHAAGNLVACSCCMASRGRADLPEGYLWCRREEKMTPASSHCTFFWRAPGSDDQVGAPLRIFTSTAMAPGSSCRPTRACGAPVPAGPDVGGRN